MMKLTIPTYFSKVVLDSSPLWEPTLKDLVLCNIELSPLNNYLSNFLKSVQNPKSYFLFLFLMKAAEKIKPRPPNKAKAVEFCSPVDGRFSTSLASEA